MKALAALKDQHAVPALLAELAQHDPVLQIEVIETLGSAGDERAAPALAAQLKHMNPYIRFACIQALGEVGRREDLPALAVLQLHDEAMIQANNGLELVSLKAAAAVAVRKIRARHHLQS